MALAPMPLTDGSAMDRARAWLEHRSMVEVPPLAVPEFGSRASSGRAWQLWLARRPHGRDRPAGRPTTASGARASRLQSHL